MTSNVDRELEPDTDDVDTTLEAWEVETWDELLITVFDWGEELLGLTEGEAEGAEFDIDDEEIPLWMEVDEDPLTEEDIPEGVVTALELRTDEEVDWVVDVENRFVEAIPLLLV